MKDNHQITRSHKRNYIGIKGREVYYRSQKIHGCLKNKEGWTCSYCAQFELDCICPPVVNKDEPVPHPNNSQQIIPEL